MFLVSTGKAVDCWERNACS